ncbi:MAG TPA: sulfatase, partial [Rubrobacter sp.]|nr:sulfatase [Rubrobacter sp.]
MMMRLSRPQGLRVGGRLASGGERSSRVLPEAGRAALLLLFACVLAGCLPTAQGQPPPEPQQEEPERPNVILIMTDDAAVGDLKYMPNLREEMVEGGTTFENAFVTNSLCCPSRATTLRGQYVHNHQVLSNEPPRGGFEKFRFLGHEDSTMATWLQEEGYRTSFFGKYMNGYAETHVPPGWDEWYGISGNFLSSTLNENGHMVDYNPDQYHTDDVLSDKASDYVERTAGADPPFFATDRPFLMWLGTKAPHQPATPAPRHEDTLENLELPKPPSFNEKDVRDKPRWVQDNPPLSPDQIAYMDELHRKRLQSMMAVDDLVGDLFDSLRESGELEDTYVFFTSDNGWHAGEHRLNTGKWTAYEEDIRVPLIVSGPGVPEGKTLPHMVLNNDLAPTFADLAGADPPKFVDGRSLTPLLRDALPPKEDWRSAFLVESTTELGPTAVPPLSGDPLPENWRRVPREYWGR